MRCLLNIGHVLRRLLAPFRSCFGISLTCSESSTWRRAALDVYADNPSVSPPRSNRSGGLWARPAVPVQYVLWLKSMVPRRLRLFDRTGARC